MNEVSSTGSSSLWRFAADTVPLNIVAKTLAFRRNGNVEFVDLQSEVFDFSLISRLQNTGLSTEALELAGLIPLLKAKILETTNSPSSSIANARPVLPYNDVTFVSLLSDGIFSGFLTTMVSPRANTLNVIITKDLEDARFVKLEKDVGAFSGHWMPVLMEPSRAVLGPLFGDAKFSHCYECFLNRMKSSLEYNHFSKADPTSEYLPVLTTWLVSLTNKIGDGHNLENPSRTIRVFDPRNGILETQSYLPAPMCLKCE